MLALTDIRLDGGTQPRAELNMSVIEDYAEAMRAGADFPPVVVFFDQNDYWLADGFHRYHGAAKAGKDEIRADIRPGSIEDARWHSYGANNTHGLRRSNEDKAQAVKAALAHPNAAKLSNVQIADHCGISEITVRRYRAELDASSTLSKIAERQVTRGGQTYTQDTTNIGRRPAVSTFTPEPDPDPLPFTDPPDGDWGEDTDLDCFQCVHHQDDSRDPDQYWCAARNRIYHINQSTIARECAAFERADGADPPVAPDSQPVPSPIVPPELSEREQSRQYMQTVMDAVPGAEERLSLSAARVNFSAIRHTIRARLLPLDPELVASIEVPADTEMNKWFIRDVRAWLDRYEAARIRGIRAVK